MRACLILSLKVVAVVNDERDGQIKRTKKYAKIESAS